MGNPNQGNSQVSEGHNFKFFRKVLAALISFWKEVISQFSTKIRPKIDKIIDLGPWHQLVFDAPASLGSKALAIEAK